MARDLDEQQQAELSAFVNSIAAAAGYTTTAEWARDSGYPASNLSNLRNGQKGVDGFNLLRLVKSAAARVDVSAELLVLGLARETDEDVLAATIAARLEELAAGVDEALALLKEAQPAPAAQPSTRQPSRASDRKRKAQ